MREDEALPCRHVQGSGRRKETIGVYASCDTLTSQLVNRTLD